MWTAETRQRAPWRNCENGPATMEGCNQEWAQPQRCPQIHCSLLADALEPLPPSATFRRSDVPNDFSSESRSFRGARIGFRTMTTSADIQHKRPLIARINANLSNGIVVVTFYVCGQLIAWGSSFNWSVDRINSIPQEAVIPFHAPLLDCRRQTAFRRDILSTTA